MENLEKRIDMAIEEFKTRSAIFMENLEKRTDMAIEEFKRQMQSISDMDICAKFPKESVRRFETDFTAKEQDIYTAGVSDGVRAAVSLMLTKLDIEKIQEAFNNGTDGGREGS